MPIRIRAVDKEGPAMSRGACADRQRKYATLRDAGNPKDNRTPGGRTVAGQSQICGWTDGRAAHRRLRRRMSRIREWQMRPLGGCLFHPGKISELGCHLPTAYGEQDLGPQFVERRGSTAQLEWGPIEVGQSHPEGQARASLASRAIRRVGKFRCPHSEP